MVIYAETKADWQARSLDYPLLRPVTNPPPIPQPTSLSFAAPAHPVPLFSRPICLFPQVAAQAAFRQGAVVVTIYATLGEEGVKHGMNETKAPVVVCDGKLLKTLLSALPSCPHIKCDDTRKRRSAASIYLRLWAGEQECQGLPPASILMPPARKCAL